VNRSAVDERRVGDQLRRVIGDLDLPPGLQLALQRFEVPLNSADRERVNPVEALGMLGQHRHEVARDNVSKAKSSILSAISEQERKQEKTCRHTIIESF